MAQVDRAAGYVGEWAYKAPCRVATTANITLSGEQTIDGVAVVTGDRVLVKNQTTTSENGIWVCDTGAWARAKDFDGARDVVKGTRVAVNEGTISAGFVYTTSVTDPVVIGTDAIAFAAEYGGANVAAAIHAATSKNTPVDADEIPIVDSAASYALKKLTFANLWVWIKNQISAVGLSGNLTFTGTGNRITGDFSNDTITDRAMIQTSIVNRGTNFHVIGNGAGHTGGFKVEDGAFLTTGNSSVAAIDLIPGDSTRISSDIRGSGTYLPMTFYTGGAERMRIDTGGNFLSTGGGGIGYGTGSGGTVTQLTSKSTDVTLNAMNGVVTTHNASLAAGAIVSFYINNSKVATTDIIIANVVWDAAANPGAYSVRASSYAPASGAILMVLKNETGGALAYAVSIRFSIIRGSST